MIHGSVGPVGENLLWRYRGKGGGEKGPELYRRTGSLTVFPGDPCLHNDWGSFVLDPSLSPKGDGQNVS